MSKLKSTIVTVTGIVSGIEFRIDLDTIRLIAQSFLQDAPRELRTVDRVIEVVALCNTLTDVINAEYEAAQKKVEEEIGEELKKEAIDESTGMVAVGTELADILSTGDKKPDRQQKINCRPGKIPHPESEQHSGDKLPA